MTDIRFLPALVLMLSDSGFFFYRVMFVLLSFLTIKLHHTDLWTSFMSVWIVPEDKSREDEAVGDAVSVRETVRV